MLLSGLYSPPDLCTCSTALLCSYWLQVRVYVEAGYQPLPLIVTGGPCTGKTVLLAHCTQQVGGVN